MPLRENEPHELVLTLRNLHSKQNFARESCKTYQHDSKLRSQLRIPILRHSMSCAHGCPPKGTHNVGETLLCCRGALLPRQGLSRRRRQAGYGVGAAETFVTTCFTLGRKGLSLGVWYRVMKGEALETACFTKRLCKVVRKIAVAKPAILMHFRGCRVVWSLSLGGDERRECLVCFMSDSGTHVPQQLAMAVRVGHMPAGT